MMKVCYPGTFDPITLGHLDIIERAASLYDEVYVMINHNPRKHCVFSEEERKDMIERSIATLPCANRVHVVIGEGLTVNAAAELGCSSIIRGIRAVSDYEYELSQATANMMLNNKVETVFLISRPEYSFLSSSTVKEIAENDGDISKLMPEAIVKEVSQRMKNRNSI